MKTVTWRGITYQVVPQDGFYKNQPFRACEHCARIDLHDCHNFVYENYLMCNSGRVDAVLFIEPTEDALKELRTKQVLLRLST